MAKVSRSLSRSTSPRYVVNLKEGGKKSADEKTNPFKWMIEGFSALLTRGAVTYYSGNFTACGFTWNLQLELNSSQEDGEKSMSLHLLHIKPSSSTGSVVKAIYKLFIYDLLFGQHVQTEGEDYFLPTSCYGTCCKVLLKIFNDPKSGLIVNDCCILGVEIQEAFTCKLEREGVCECLSINKEITPAVVYTWVIKDFLKLNSSQVCETFAAGSYQWRIKLFPNVDPYKESLAIFLALDNPTALSSKTRVYVEFTVSVLNQIDGKHEKSTARHHFSSEQTNWGWRKFVPWKGVEDPSKGLVRNGTCIIEASVTVLGLVTVVN